MGCGQFLLCSFEIASWIVVSDGIRSLVEGGAVGGAKTNWGAGLACSAWLAGACPDVLMVLMCRDKRQKVLGRMWIWKMMS